MNTKPGNKYKLEDLIDIKHFQDLLDKLSVIFPFPSAILDNDGNILTATGWQEICTKFHRKNKESEKVCIQSDKYIFDHLDEANPAVKYQCAHGFSDNAIPIIIDGIHYGNFFTGQFFLEEPDMAFFRKQAKKYGFKEKEYLEAVQKVSICSKEQLDSYLTFFKELIAVISESGLKNLREIENRKKIQESEKRYKSILQTTIDGFWLVDMSGNLLDVNDAYCKMSGYSHEDLVKMRVTDLEVAETPKEIAQHLNEVMIKGQDRFLSIHRRKDGSLFDVEVSMQYQPENGGSVVSFFRNIEDSKKAEKALRASEEKYRQLFESMRDAYGSIDLKGNITDTNNAFNEMLGYTLEEFKTLTYEDITPKKWHPAEFNILESQVLHRGYSDIYEKELTHKNGSILPIEMRSFLLKDDYGNARGMWAIIRDISERKKTEASLREREDLLNKTQEIASLGSFVWDMVTNKITWSHNLYKIYGYDEESFTGNIFEVSNKLIHPDDAERANKEVIQMIEETSSWDVEFRIIRADGDIRIIRSKGEVERDEDGKQVKCYGINQDVTERRKYEESLEKGEKLHETILQTTIDGYMQIDGHGYLVEVNDAYCNMSGYSRGELLNMNAGKLEAAPPSQELKEKINEIVEKKTHRFIRRHRKKDGSFFDVEISSQYLTELEGFVCLIRDITERKRLEDSLSASLERLDLATNAARLGIWDWDLKNDKLIWDDGMYSIYRIQKEEEKNLYEAWHSSLHPDDREYLVNIISRAKENDLAYDTEYRIFWPDRTLRYIKAVGKIINDSNGNAVRMIGVNYDITKNREMEAQLQQAQKMESIGTLAGGIAHDFNNILSPIMMHAEMAMEDLAPDHTLQESMKEIFHSGERARDLVKQILTFARKGLVKRSVLKSSPIIKDAVKFLRSTIPTSIDINFDNRANRDIILADPTQLNQIIMNLSANAAYAMREKGKLLEIILDNEEITRGKNNRFFNLNPGSYLKLTVKDDGTGIPHGILSRIFEPYYTTKNVGEGTGLGLAIVHGIVQKYGGDIIVETEEGHGTAFHVYLPLINSEISQEKETRSEIQRGTEKLLVVDDEKAAIDIIQKILEKFGYRITTTTSSREALEIFKNNPEGFDLLITDMTMPEKTGDVLAKEIMAIRPEFPVILCTGFSDSINEEKAKKIGIRHFILKPIIMSELARVIREELDRA